MKLFILLLFFISIHNASAQKLEDISNAVNTILKDSRVPSMSVAVVKDGKIIAAGAAGIRKHGEKRKVTMKDKYHLGSCTKSMTATLAAILVKSGKLKWDTTVSEVFKDVKIHKTFQNTTLKQLLTNTGGVTADTPRKLWGELWQSKKKLPEQRMLLVRGILEQPATYQPGTKDLYSNAGFSIAGAMLEEVTGTAYEKLLTKLLFKPLKMDSAGFRAPARNGKVDQPYGHLLDGEKIVATDPEPHGDNPSAIAPAGAVHCSVIDFAKYALLHLGNGPKNLLNNDDIKELHKPTKVSSYAMGWIVTADNSLTHAGSNTMFYSLIWLVPGKNIGVVALCNYGDEEGYKKCDKAVIEMLKKYIE